MAICKVVYYKLIDCNKTKLQKCTWRHAVWCRQQFILVCRMVFTVGLLLWRAYFFRSPSLNIWLIHNKTHTGKQNHVYPFQVDLWKMQWKWKWRGKLSNNRGKSTKLAVCINILDKMVWFGPIICFSESKAELWTSEIFELFKCDCKFLFTLTQQLLAVGVTCSLIILAQCLNSTFCCLNH